MGGGEGGVKEGMRGREGVGRRGRRQDKGGGTDRGLWGGKGREK